MNTSRILSKLSTLARSRDAEKSAKRTTPESRGKTVALIYADAPAENIIKRLEEIYQRKLSREEALLEVAIIKGDDGTLEAFGWKKADMDDEELEAWKAREPERFLEQDPFVLGGGIIKQLEDEHDKPDKDENDEDEDDA